MGTLWAHTWDEVWGATVERWEDEQGRRICGAKTLAGNPCTLTSRHRTGRCEFHGGTDAIGAPAGNSNARIHGLYARRLQRCGPHCPMWQHCPFASADVLELDPPERPNCAYETAEYDAVLQEFENDESGASTLPFGDDEGSEPESPNSIRENPSNPPNPRTHSTQHNLALLHVMVSRAAAALSVLSFTDDVTSDTERYHMHTTKVHAALDAFLRLSREHRATLAQYHRDLERERKFEAEGGRPPSLADVAAPLLEDSEGIIEQAIAVEEERQRQLEYLMEENLRLKTQLNESPNAATQSSNETGEPAPAEPTPDANTHEHNEAPETRPIVMPFSDTTGTNHSPRAP